MKNKRNTFTACVIVAHPDDETLWMGGTILSFPEWQWEIYTLCRASDQIRAPRFYRAISIFGAKGQMADLDDGPEQYPLDENDVQKKIKALTNNRQFDCVVTHAPHGEYTRHRRHEETSKAVQSLWFRGKLKTRNLWIFAYSDGNGEHLPKAIAHASRQIKLSKTVWQKKYRIITDIYGFSPDSWEARVTPKREAFWCFESPSDLKTWLTKKGGRR